MSDAALPNVTGSVPFEPRILSYRRRVETAKADDVRADLLLGFKDPLHGPIPFDPSPTPERQLYYISRTLADEPRETLKIATARAVSDWDVELHPPRVLASLACLGAYLHATGVIPHLREKLSDERLACLRDFSGSHTEATAFDDLTEYILRVLLGFAPDPEVRSCFEFLFREERPSPRFAGLLLVGLCKCRPEAYPEYVPHFIDVLDKYPGLFPRLDVTAERLLVVVPIGIVAAHLHKLNGRPLQRFLRIICGEAWSPLRLEPSAEPYLEHVDGTGRRGRLNARVETILDAMPRAIRDPVGLLNRAVEQRSKEPVGAP